MDVVPYDRFRTGFTFAEVRTMLWSYSEDPRDWPRGISRHTVLGRWREIKLEMYDRYLQDLQQMDEIPF